LIAQDINPACGMIQAATRCIAGIDRLERWSSKAKKQQSLRPSGYAETHKQFAAALCFGA
jgi:hypothetical protein